MFRDLCREPIVLRFPDGTFADGVSGYTECSARAFVFDYSKRLLKDLGLQENSRFFIIAAAPKVDAGFAVGLSNVKVRSDGLDYDLKSVKACRGVDGAIECYNCIAF